MSRFVTDLRTREPERREAGCRMRLIAHPVPCLLRGRAVVDEPVGFDHEAEVGQKKSTR
jgi:hypothetical protein